MHGRLRGALGILLISIVAFSAINLSGALHSPAAPTPPVTIDVFVEDGNHAPVKNPFLFALLVEKEWLKRAEKQRENHFRFTLDEKEQTSEIAIYCSCLGTFTVVPHLSGKSSQSFTIVHRSWNQITRPTHVVDQLNAFRSAEALVLGTSSSKEKPEYVRALLDPLVDSQRQLETRLADMKFPDEGANLKRRLIGETKSITKRLNEPSFQRMLKK